MRVRLREARPLMVRFVLIRMAVYGVYLVFAALAILGAATLGSWMQ